MIERWTEGMERKGLRVNLGKTKVMKCQLSSGQAEDSGSGHVGCVGKVLVKTRFSVECAKSGCTRNVLV
jgi:hypothetical protein